MTVTAVFFDVGETLVNESRLWAERGQEAGVAPHVVWAAMGAVIERRDDHRRIWDVLAVRDPGRAFEWATEDFYADALPCLAALRQGGYFIGLAGNVASDLAPFVETHGLDVDFVASSHTLGAEKPSRDFFARLVEAAGRPAAQIAYVGDRIDNDVLPAVEAGMVAVHVLRGPWGYLQAHWPEAGRATARIRSLHELPEVLRAG